MSGTALTDCKLDFSSWAYLAGCKISKIFWHHIWLTQNKTYPDAMLLMPTPCKMHPSLYKLIAPKYGKNNHICNNWGTIINMEEHEAVLSICAPFRQLLKPLSQNYMTTQSLLSSFYHLSPFPRLSHFQNAGPVHVSINFDQKVLDWSGKYHKH